MTTDFTPRNRGRWPSWCTCGHRRKNHSESGKDGQGRCFECACPHFHRAQQPLPMDEPVLPVQL